MTDDGLSRRRLLQVAGAGALGAIVPLGATLTPLAAAASVGTLAPFGGYTGTRDDNLFGAGRFQRGYWYGTRAGGFSGSSAQRGAAGYARWDEPSGYKVCRRSGFFPWVVAPHEPGPDALQTATVGLLNGQSGGLLLSDVTPGTIYARSYVLGPVRRFTGRTYQFSAILQPASAGAGIDVGCYVNLRFRPNDAKLGDSPKVRAHIFNSNEAGGENGLKRIEPASFRQTLLYTQTFGVPPASRYRGKAVVAGPDTSIPYSPSLECALFVKSYTGNMKLGVVQVALTEGAGPYDPAAKRVT